MHAIAYFDEEFAFELYDLALPTLRSGLQSNTLDQWEQLQEIIWHLHGYVPRFLRHRKPTRRQRKLSKELAECLPTEAISRDIQRSRQGDWERYARFLGGWLYEVNKKVYRKIVSNIDMDVLYETTKEHWAVPPRELRLLFSTLSGLEGGEPARSWILTHQDMIKEIDPITAELVPEVAVAAVARGATVNLTAHNGSDWKLQASALARIAMCDEITAHVVLRYNSRKLADAISVLGLHRNDSDHELPVYLDVIGDISPELITHVFSQVQISEARDNWKKKLAQKGMKSKRVLASVIRHALSCDGELPQLAIEVHRKLPKKLREEFALLDDDTLSN